MKPPAFERSGWARLDISAPAQARIESEFTSCGVAVEVLDVREYVAQFDAWRHLREYEGEYKNYAGDLALSLLEKALEHFLSVVLARPRQGMTAVDVGSCRSVVPSILRRIYGVRCLEQDLTYPVGVHDDRVGSSADSIPLDAGSVDFMTLHCAFEHFEGGADTGFVGECARLLSPSGRVTILPLYLNGSHCNITGVTDPASQSTIGWDPGAQHYCEIPEWQNRFGRHYSVLALLERVIAPAIRAGLRPRLIKVTNWDAVDADLWLRWILVLEQGPRAIGESPAAADPRLGEIKVLREKVEAQRDRADAVLRERDMLDAQLADLRRQFEFVEADRVARGRVIEEQGRKSVALESAVYLTEQNRDWHRAEAARLSAELEELDRALRQEIAGLRRDLVDRDQAIAKTQANWWVRAGRRLKLL